MSFSPTSISGISSWFDATDANSITLSGSNVTQWNDKSGRGYNLTAVSGYANATVSSAYQNGLNVLNFSGNGLYRTAGNGAVYPQDVYIIIALKSTTANVDVLGMGPTGSDYFNSLTFGEYTASRWHNGSSGYARTPNCVSPTNETSTSFLLIQWSLADSNFLLRRNGSDLVQTNSYTYSLNGGSIFQIGFRHTDRNAANFSGYIGEILVYNTQIATSQRQQVEAYLSWKWGIQSSLPSSHPYRYNGLMSVSYISTPISIPSNAMLIPFNSYSTIKTFNLPVASTNAGRMLIFKDMLGTSATFPINLSTIGLDRIERTSVSSMALSQAFGAWTFMNDGRTNWFLTDVYQNTFPIELNRGGQIPKSVATLTLWLDATDPTNGGAIPSANSVVTTWYDKSGLGNNITGYNSPTFLTSPYRMSNFSGAYFYATSPNSYLMTLFIVYYDNNNDSCAPVYTENHDAGTTGLFANCNGTTYLQVNGGDWATQGSSIPKNTRNLLMIQYTNTNARVWLNGTANFEPGTGTFTRTGISFGKRGGNYMHGFYYEIVHYSSVITTTDRQRIEGYLAWKWEIQNNLPSGHPYKSSAP